MEEVLDERAARSYARAVKSPEDAAEWLRRGILACRRERWHEGYDLLARAASAVPKQSDLPARVFSFLGVAMARCEGRRREGLELCRYAVKREPREAENWGNLAVLYLMVGERRKAVRALDKGLWLSADNESLLRMRTEVGCRRRPPLPFLSRENPLNVAAGRLRHRLMTKVERRRAQRAADEADRAEPGDSVEA